MNNTEKEKDKSYEVMYKAALIGNILFYLYAINHHNGIFDLMPMAIETHQGLVVRIPYLHYILNIVLLLHCLFIKHWYVIFLYVSVLVFEAFLAVGLNHMLMVGYSWGQSVWGVVILVSYLFYRRHENQFNTHNRVEQ